jgi:hypothetical protein
MVYSPNVARHVAQLHGFTTPSTVAERRIFARCL